MDWNLMTGLIGIGNGLLRVGSIFAVVVLCLASSSPVAAADGKKSKTSKPKTAEEEIVIPADSRQADANAMLLKKFDLNKNGKIDEWEIAEAQSKGQTNRTPNFTKTEEGRKLTIKDLYEGGDPAKHRRATTVNSDDFLKQYDVNNNGQLDAVEIELMKRDLGKGKAVNTGPKEPARTPIKPLPPSTAPSPERRQLVR